jgi:hypothetical protein
MSNNELSRRFNCVVWFVVIGLCVVLSGCTFSATPTVVVQEPPTPTPEVFIPRTATVPQDPVTPTSEPLPSQIVRLDETWYQYTNYQLGFSFKFPRTTVSQYGFCKWTEENGDHSYRPEPAFVPVKVFEDGNTTYIAGEFYYELTGETTETSAGGATRAFFSDCQAVTNNLELLGDPDNYYQTRWEIVTQEVHDDGELDAFLKSRYGSGCRLGEKIASSQDGVYDIRVQGDGKDLGETQCPLNYVTVVKYYPVGNKVVAWNLGQAPRFVADTAYPVVYDQEMVNSFRFLTGVPTEESASQPNDGTVEQALPESCQVWGHDIYVDRANGFCFAYPPLFEAQVNEMGNPAVYGPALDSNLEPLRANLLVEVKVAIQDKMLAEIVDAYLEQFAGLDVPPITRTPFELGGQPAEMLEVVPGREGSCDVFMLHQGMLFHLMFMPSVRDFPQAKDDVELLFDTVVSSFALMSPGSTGPGQPVPPVSNELAYTRVEIAEAGLSFDVPAGWLRLEPAWVWTPSEDSALRLGVAWADLQPPQEAEAAMLPTSAVVLRSEPLTVDWGNGQLFTVAVYGEQATLQSVEMHALIVIVQDNVRRAFDLYLVAPDEAQVVEQQVVLQHMLDTAVVSH